MKNYRFDNIYFNPACTGDGGKIGDLQSRGTCDVGKVCSPDGNCVGKSLYTIFEIGRFVIFLICLFT